MRLMKIPLFLLMVLVLWASGAQAQLNCADITPSPNDFVQVKPFLGKPGDTARLPIFYSTDSISAGFRVLVKIDTSFLTPVYVTDTISGDSGFVDYSVTSARFPKSIDTVFDEFGFPLRVDTFYNLVVSEWEGHKDILTCNFLPFGDIDSLPGGDDQLFSVKFIVKPLGHANKVFHNATTSISLYQANQYLYFETNGLPDSTLVGCARTELSTLWFDSLTWIEDTVNLTPLVIDTIYVATTYQVWPTTTNGGFRVDTAYVDVADPSVSISANPSSISAGQGTTLSINALNVDSVNLFQGTTTGIKLIQYTSGFPRTYPVSSLTSTTQYSVVGYHSTKIATASTTVTVGGGQIGNPPVLSYNPTTKVYTIDQGQTVSFGITATGASGQSITLSLLNPPNNANLSPTNPILGTQVVSGTCSFTPDFNQFGTFTLQFQGISSPNGGTINDAVTVVVNKLQSDRLFSLSTPGQKPVGGLKGTPGIRWPINLVTDKTFYGVQFDVAWPYQQVQIDSFTVTGRIPEYVVYDNLNVTPGIVRVLAFGLDGVPVGVDSASGSAIMSAWLTLDSSAVPWTTYWLGLQSGRGSINPNPNVGSVPLVTDSGVVECDNPGDVNLDKFIDVGDLVNIVAKIIGTFDLTYRQFRTADIIADSSVNVFDLVADINFIYGLPINPSPAQPTSDEVATMSLAYDNIANGATEVLAVRSDLPTEVAGVELAVDYDPEAVTLGIPKLTTFNEKFTINYKNDGSGRMKVLLYHVRPFRFNELLQKGLADLIEIPVTAKQDIRSGDRMAIRLTQALLSTAGAGSVNVEGVDETLPNTFMLRQNYPNPFNPVTTIEFSVPVSDKLAQSTKLEIFNVLGQRVKTLIDDVRGPGDYKVSWDATSDAGRRVATGLYLYRLQVGDDNQTKKMLFLK